MTKWLRCLLICALIFGFLPVTAVQAVRGVPGSAEFGYGAWLHPNGEFFDQGLALVQDLALDWVGVEVDWAALAATSDTKIDTAILDRAVSTAASSGTAVMFSLTNPPDWAMTPAGPDTAATAGFVLNLSTRYGDKLCAIELLPGANTTAGWHANPDPAAYANLWLTVRSQLDTAGSSLHLIAGGLRPWSAASAPADWTDLDFLRGLYAAGAKDWMSVVSIQFPQLTGLPLQTTADSGTPLRHYEAVRQVMQENNHQTGQIWVTLFNSPDGTISVTDSRFADRQHQTEWLQQALIQVRSQLYMGVVFAHNLNPAQSNSTLYRYDALVVDRVSVHPFYSVFKAIIRQTNPETGAARPGKPKGTILLKCKYKT